MTGRQVLANVAANLRFFLRNRLLAAFLLVMLALLGLSLVPMLLFSTNTQKFNLITQTYTLVDMVVYLLVALMALMHLSHHMHSRSLKMVITRPCSIETWLLSGYLTAIGTAAVLYAALFCGESVLFLAWGVPYQLGLLLVVGVSFCHAVIIYSWLTLLTALLHPVLAAILSLVFQEGLFYFILLMVMSGIKAAETFGGAAKPVLIFLLKVLTYGVKLVYLVLPSYSPAEDRLTGFMGNWRLASGNWATFGWIALYAVCVAVASFCFTSLILRKQRHT